MKGLYQETGHVTSGFLVCRCVGGGYVLGSRMVTHRLVTPAQTPHHFLVVKTGTGRT